MILVDTSVWAAYFNGESLPEVDLLDRLLEDKGEEIVIIPLILTETLQGFRSDRSFKKAENLLRNLTTLDPSLDNHVRAAELFRRLRRKGITVRGAIDCLIAQVCLDSDARLLSLDRDFALIAQHEGLILAQDAFSDGS